MNSHTMPPPTHTHAHAHAYVTRAQRAAAEGRNWPDGYRLEQELFHASPAWADICAMGFNRSFAGKNACKFGKGCYFARDASYSADPKYCVPDESNVARILVCRVVRTPTLPPFPRGAHPRPWPPPSHPYSSSRVYPLPLTADWRVLPRRR